MAKLLKFSNAEYTERLAKTRADMVRREVDVLVITDPANIAWLTGYDGYSFYNHQAALISLDRDPIWYGRAVDVNGAKLTVYMSDDNILNYPDSYVQTTERHPFDPLGDIFIKRDWQNARVGVELDNFYLPAASFFSLQKHLPNAKFVDITVMINWIRAAKSKQEMEYMRRAGRILEVVQSRIFEKAEPGVRKCDLAAEIYDAALRGTPEFGGDYPAIVPLLASGTEAAACHLTWDDRPLKQGEGTFFEVAGVYNHYHVPMSRTIFFGKPTQEFLDAEKATLEGLEAGLEVAKPGNTCEDVAIAFFGVLEKHGIRKDNRTGYPVGLAYPPDWGERTMSFRRGDRTVLEPGMTFHFMTGLWTATMGFEVTETIAITDAGVECLATVPRKLFIK
jgi:ectoine hydrolase